MTTEEKLLAIEKANLGGEGNGPGATHFYNSEDIAWLLDLVRKQQRDQYKLIEALEYYADAYRYSDHVAGGSIVMKDSGEKARQTLLEIKGEE